MLHLKKKKKAISLDVPFFAPLMNH
uniref:Uncharacterized protein n=1 Tax=Arundo donax TaxID=35708 RepID=A0A0A9BB75_ARUDO